MLQGADPIEGIVVGAFFISGIGYYAILAALEPRIAAVRRRNPDSDAPKQLIHLNQFANLGVLFYLFSLSRRDVESLTTYRLILLYRLDILLMLASVIGFFAGALHDVPGS